MPFNSEKKTRGLEKVDTRSPRTGLAILVVSYNSASRAALVSSLNGYDVSATVCTTFLEAEEHSLQGLYNGLLVDLPSMVKAKGEEKIVAYTLANFFPTLRVRAIGAALVPMVMPGSAKQDNSLVDFLTKTCPAFPPSRPRAHKRHPVCLFTVMRYGGEELRGFTLDVSWGGAFIVVMRPERFSVGEGVDVYLPQFDRSVRVNICWIMPWGIKSAPGIGVSFTEMDEELETILSGVLKTRKEFDRDRLSAG